MKKINLVVVEGPREFGGVDNLQYEDLIRFGITDLSLSDPYFLFHLKSLVGTYAYEFFDMDFDESEKLLKKSKTLEEIEAVAKKSIRYDGDSEFKHTYRIVIIEIKNEVLLEGLIHISESCFIEEYGVGEKVKELKKDGKFKEALELMESFNKLKDLVKSKPELVSQTESERMTKFISRIPSGPEPLKKKYQAILEEFYIKYGKDHFLH
jgi:hypothetical protein